MSRSVALSVGEKPPDEWAALERGASLFARRSWIEALDEEAVGASAVWAVATGSRPEVGLFGHLARDPGWSAPRTTREA